MNMICTKCHESKPESAFGKSSAHKSGFLSWCRDCESIRSKAKYLGRKDAQLEKAKQWRESNKEKYLASIDAWRERNPGRYESAIKRWANRNRGAVNAKWMKREAGKKQRTPLWLSSDHLWMIEQAYEIAAVRSKMLGIPFHVDHIVPLQGKTVSGLHVPWNLQVITARENREKSNRLETQLEGI